MPRLDDAPRMGWVDTPSPVQALPALAAELGLGWLGVKRDDMLPALFGGTKVRKLDRLLARPPYRGARRWSATGAIGSGQLACLAAAAEAAGIELEAHTFWQVPTAHALENLGFLATRADLRYHGTRLGMVLAAPTRRPGNVAVVPVGATGVPGMLALVEAGLELGEQVRAGELPEPDRVVVPFGSGGTAVGLAAGLAMAGLRARVWAVSAVERVFSTHWRVEALRAALARALPGARFAPIDVDHGALGKGYAVPTAAGLAAAARFAGAGVPLEPAYGGKAAAALCSHPPKGERVLFWYTARRGPLPVDPGWRERLPRALNRRLDGHDPWRRALLLGGAAVAVTTAVRATGYDRYPAWDGKVLYAREAEVLRAVAEAVLPPAPLDGAILDGLPARTDTFLVAMSPAARLEVHGLFLLVEQAGFSRFTRRSPAARLAFLEGLDGLGGLAAVAARGIRDLALLGYYQSPETWPALGYEGPMVGPDPRPSAYDDLRAGPGVAP